jgi:hypothetical protein
MFLDLPTNDPAFDAEMRSAAYPDGLAGFSYTPAIFVYSQAINCWPRWGPTWGASETQPWAIEAGFNGSIPKGLLRRGPYEIYLYGVENWINNVVNPNVDAWAMWMAKQRNISNPLTFTGEILLDFTEDFVIYSFSGLGATNGAGKTVYQYFKDSTGLTNNAARLAWENILTAVYFATIQRIRLRFPAAKLGDPYLVPAFYYQIDDTSANGAAIVPDTGRTTANEIRYQTRGKTPTQFAGGKAGWLTALASRLDWADFEFYCKIGYSTPYGGVVNVEGVALTTVPVGTNEYYNRLYAEECVRLASVFNKPLRLWMNPRYGVGKIPNTGLNDYDAAMMVSMVKQYNAKLGLWINAFNATPQAKQGIREGMRNLNPHIARAFNLSMGGLVTP